MFDKFKSIMKTLGFRGEDPIATRHDLVDFIDSRAAYVSQVTLYTYVKAVLAPNIRNYLKMRIF